MKKLFLLIVSLCFLGVVSLLLFQKSEREVEGTLKKQTSSQVVSTSLGSVKDQEVVEEASISFVQESVLEKSVQVYDEAYLEDLIHMYFSESPEVFENVEYLIENLRSPGDKKGTLSQRIPLEKGEYSSLLVSFDSELSSGDIYKISLNSVEMAENLFKLMTEESYSFTVEPDVFMTLQASLGEGDPLQNQRSELSLVNYDYLMVRSLVQTPVTVAVIDSGVDYMHVDIRDNIALNLEDPVDGIDNDGSFYIDDVRGWDFAQNDSDPMDKHGHGTHVAGVIAGRSGNGQGISGFSPLNSIKILPLKVTLDSLGGGSLSFTIQALYYVLDHTDCRVVNISMGSGHSSPMMKKVVQALEEKGVIIVAAAGNDSSSSLSYPAIYPQVIAVASVNSGLNRSSFSNYGRLIDVSAPGEGVLSLLSSHRDPAFGTQVVSGQYVTASGTSMATPMVSGLAALLLSVFPELTGSQVRSIIYSTVRSKNESLGIGSGVIRCDTALSYDTSNLSQLVDVKSIMKARQVHLDEEIRRLNREVNKMRRNQMNKNYRHYRERWDSFKKRRDRSKKDYKKKFELRPQIKRTSSSSSSSFWKNISSSRSEKKERRRSSFLSRFFS